MVEFNFNDLYKTDELSIEIGDYTLFVVVQEIPHGQFVELQKRMMGELKVTRNKREMERQIENIKISAPDFSDQKSMLGIRSLAIQNGSEDITALEVTLEAWHKLPHWVTEQIEEAIERLNPELDDEFQD